jgi:transcriptional repressor NrdR
MKCPYCGHEGQRVLDSRPARDGEAVRRRRECEACRRRYTTFEAPERARLLVVKRNGVREPFDREKLVRSLVVACRKRPVPVDRLEQAADDIERALFDLCTAEVGSREVGDRALRQLYAIDAVAFVRFASVYREFESIREFEEITRQLRPRTDSNPPDSLFALDKSPAAAR